LLNLNLKDKLKLSLKREVVSPVSQAVSEMIENYLEENPNDARIIVQVILQQARHAAKKRVKWSNVKP
jgi:DNA gyrase/topoisomerase IV subunit B